MKFRRKSSTEVDGPAGDATAEDAAAEGAPQEESSGQESSGAAEGEQARGVHGPRDVDDVDLDGEQTTRVDLGALLIAPRAGMQLRMQVDEASQRVQAVILTTSDGALEVMAFAAPRNGDLWDEVRPQIAADMARRGGTATEREGRWGTELVCRLQVQRGDGTPTVQPSRIIGIDGPRWMVRATLLGRPAVEAEAAAAWEAVIADLVVRRGSNPMPVGDQLPIVLPPEARPVS